MKGLIYVLIILLVGAIGGYLLGQKIDEWRMARTPQKIDARASEDLTQEVTDLLNREKLAYQSHDADQLLQDCASNYTEVNGNVGESMDLARARLFYHNYFQGGQAVSLTIENLKVTPASDAVIAQADYRKTSNSFSEKNIQGYKGQGTWVFVRQNSTWRLASLVWAEQPY